MDRSDKVFVLIVIAAVAAALFLALGRARIERANRTVEIVIDGDDARLVAAASGTTLPVFLADLRGAGACSLAVREKTIGDLVEDGRLLAVSLEGETNLITPDGRLAAVLAPSMAARLPHIPMELASPPPMIAVQMPTKELSEVPVLLLPEQVAAAEAAGLGVVARLRNFEGASAAAVEAATEQAVSAGAHLIIFDREEVLGYDGLLGVTAESLGRHDLLFGLVEMAAQRGEDGLAGRLGNRVVRVHSITENDMLTMAPSTAVPRYARAVHERNIRAVYVRLIARARADPAAYNVAYVKAIADAIRADGFELGRAAPFSGPKGWPPRWPRAAVALGVVAGAMLLLRRLLSLSAAWSWLVWVMALAVGTGAASLKPELVARVGGLGAAVVFPSLAVVWALQGVGSRGPRGGFGRVLGAAAWRLVGASAISLAGAMLIVGLYSRVGYLSGVALFTGVKLSLLVPLVVVLAAVIVDLPWRIEPIGRWWPRTRLRAEQFLSRPINALQAAIVLAALGAVAFALTRSGNQPVVSPSGLEVKLRAVLEAMLAIRPRTKEFLLGHPALMLGVALALRGRRAWLPLAALVAALGQVSLLNTFCHFHTPLSVSLLRTANGLWMGALIGTIVIVVWRAVFDRRSRVP
ncbi:MAG TPA: DUF5693 family protein [Armatimonadota bacterium]|nr:DUF5693 family protein [Armatimonadota bacterium]